MLRDYQIRAVDSVMAKIRERPLLLMPTGSGKTQVARELLRRALAKNLRCLFLVHRKELVTQARDRFSEDPALPLGIIKAGFPEDRTKPLQIASVQTLARREAPEADFVIVDEAHHAVSASWAKLIRHYDGKYLLGLTATACRLDGKGLGAIFGTIVQGATTRELCEKGVLVTPLCYSHPIPNLSSVRMLAGDYHEGDLARAMDKLDLIGDMRKHWFEHAGPSGNEPGKRTVAFAVNISHSKHIRDAFLFAGVKAAHIDGSTPNEERAVHLAALRDAEICVLSNCSIITEGWDLPSLECLILARPTKSLSLYRQMIGRGMRIADGKKTCVVLDHAGNVLEHGLVTNEPVYSLDDKVKVPRAPPIKACPECYAVCAASCTTCPECGFVFFVKDAVPEHAQGKLVLHTENSAAIAMYTKWVEQANRRGNKLGWAMVRFKEKFGDWPSRILPIAATKEIEKRYVCVRHIPEEKNGRTRCSRCYTRIQRGA